MVKRRKRSKKWISWLVMLILLIVAGILCYFVWDNYFKNETEEKSVVDEVEVIDEPVTDRIEERDVKKDDEVEKKTVLYDGENPNEMEVLTGVVTYAGATGDNLMIRVNIDQYLEEGECRLALYENGAVIYRDDTQIVGGASTATCEGFNVPISEIGSGNYEIVINLNSGEKVGTIRGEASI